MFYAQINEQGICFAVTQAAEIISQADMIGLDFYDRSLLGKKWTGDSWEEVPVEPVEPQPDRITELEAVVDALLTGGVTP
jgi:hypothetical protein